MKIKIALHLFSEEELDELGTALDLRWLGNQPAIADCFHACRQLFNAIPDWGERELSKLLYPGANPEAKIKYLRTRTTALMRHLEQFLAWKSFQRDQVMQDYCLVSELRRRDWDDEYRRSFSEAIKRTNQAPLHGFGHFSMKYATFDKRTKTADQEPHTRTNTLIQDAIDALDKAYLLKKLALACNAASFDREFQTTHRVLGIPDDHWWAKNPKLEQDPLINLYRHLLKITRDTSVSSDPEYKEARKLFFDHADEMGQSNLTEAQDVITHLINFCTIRCNQKAVHFYAELAGIYRKSISSGILLVEDKIGSLEFINAFTAFTLAKDDASAEWIIDGFTDKIYGEAGLATKHYCLGFKAFYEGEIQNADESFFAALNSPPKSKWPPLEALILAHLARTRYMLQQYEDAEHHCKSLLARISQKGKLDRNKSVSFFTFCTYLIQLCQAQRWKGKRRQRVVEGLKKKGASKTTSFFASRWVMMQIDGI